MKRAVPVLVKIERKDKLADEVLLDEPRGLNRGPYNARVYTNLGGQQRLALMTERQPQPASDTTEADPELLGQQTARRLLAWD